MLMPDSNLPEAPDLLSWALRHGYRLRFIEHMPLDAQHQWNRTAMVTAEQMLDELSRSFRLSPIGRPGAESAPAEQFEILDGPGLAEWPRSDGPPTVGVIASVTRPFCRDLRPPATDLRRTTAHLPVRPRPRPTCAGRYAPGPTNSNSPRSSGPRWRASASREHGIDSRLFLQPARPMSAIGG